MYLLNREKGLNTFLRSTDIHVIQVLNELPTNKRHIKFPQDRLLCPTHFDNKKKQVCENFLCKCVTCPYLNGVPLIHVHVVKHMHQYTCIGVMLCCRCGTCRTSCGRVRGRPWSSFTRLSPPASNTSQTTSTTNSLANWTSGSGRGRRMLGKKGGREGEALVRKVSMVPINKLGLKLSAEYLKKKTLVSTLLFRYLFYFS